MISLKDGFYEDEDKNQDFYIPSETNALVKLEDVSCEYLLNRSHLLYIKWQA